MFCKNFYLFVLDKMLKSIRGVRLDNRKVFRAPVPRTKHFNRVCQLMFYNLTGLLHTKISIKILNLRIV